MSLFSAHHAKTQYDQPQPAEAPKKPTFQTKSEYQTKAKKQNATSMQMPFPVHTNTPCIFYAGGVHELTA